MKKIITFVTMLLSILCVNLPSRAEASSAQEMYAAASGFISTLDEMNSILAGVYNQQTADAAAEPLKQAAIRFFSQLQTIQSMKPDGPMDKAMEQKIMALMAKGERGQATFMKHCQRIGQKNAFGSQKLIQTFLYIGSMGKK